MKKEEQFRTINTLEYNRIVHSIPSLYKIAKYFKDNFFGKKVVYCTRNQKISVYFSESNFMHLCGLHYSRGAKNFFLDCLDKKLDVSSLLVKKDGTTFQKLAILNSVTELTSPHVRLTGSGRYLYLEFDYALRTKKQILALTLKDTSKKIVPQSLLDLKKKRDFPKGEDIIKIYAVDFYTGKEWIYYTEEIDLKEK
ncbi:PBECR4 domain-containing protein [uncultured Granulicatella sp.]|uniref:PBECR4 domain-containing protein n=1 Tax=uncultured Granulicatella sp. TaxID=316089 RepID=UPI0028DC63E5|nr:PBECR4 domain-containing protein [uncultured Granulicatella sp.]